MRIITFLFSSLLFSSAAYAASPTPIGNEDCGKVLSTNENDTFIVSEQLWCTLEDGEAALTIESGVTLLGEGINIQAAPDSRDNSIGLRIIGDYVTIITPRIEYFTTGIEVLGNNIRIENPSVSLFPATGIEVLGNDVEIIGFGIYSSSYNSAYISVGHFAESHERSPIRNIKILHGGMMYNGRTTTEPLIRLHNVDNVEISNTKIQWDYPPADTGIVFTGENKNVWIHNNEVNGMLSIHNGHNFLVENNSFGTAWCYSDLVHDFISLSGESSKNTITNNTVYGSSGHGISISRGSIFNTVTKNQVYRSAEHNLYDGNIDCEDNDWSDNINDNNNPINPVCASE